MTDFVGARKPAEEYRDYTIAVLGVPFDEKASYLRGASGRPRAIRTLQSHGLRVAVRVTIHSANVDDLEATARLLLEDLGLPGFGTNAAGYLGSCRMNEGNALPGLAYTLTGKVDHPSPDACLRRFLDEGGSLAGLFNE